MVLLNLSIVIYEEYFVTTANRAFLKPDIQRHAHTQVHIRSSRQKKELKNKDTCISLKLKFKLQNIVQNYSYKYSEKPTTKGQL